MPDSSCIHLDLSHCQTLYELHQRIREAFDFPDWYGCNWDAFYDLMRTDVAANKVIITGEYSVATDLLDELDNLHQVLQLLVQFNLNVMHEIFTYEILS